MLLFLLAAVGMIEKGLLKKSVMSIDAYLIKENGLLAINSNSG
jgi:hypothetical protein